MNTEEMKIVFFGAGVIGGSVGGWIASRYEHIYLLDQGENLGPRLALALGQLFQFPDAFGLGLLGSSSPLALPLLLSLPQVLELGAQEFLPLLDLFVFLPRLTIDGAHAPELSPKPVDLSSKTSKVMLLPLYFKLIGFREYLVPLL